LCAQANPDENSFADIFPRYDYFYKRYGFDESHLIRACGVREAGEAEGRGELLMSADKTAGQLFDGKGGRQ